MLVLVFNTTFSFVPFSFGFFSFYLLEYWSSTLCLWFENTNMWVISWWKPAMRLKLRIEASDFSWWKVHWNVSMNWPSRYSKQYDPWKNDIGHGVPLHFKQVFRQIKSEYLYVHNLLRNCSTLKISFNWDWSIHKHSNRIMDLIFKEIELIPLIWSRGTSTKDLIIVICKY